MEIERLERSDMDAAAVIMRAGMAQTLPWLLTLHNPEEDRMFLRQTVYDSCRLWGIRENGHLIGFMAKRQDCIDQLHVAPPHQRRGIGAALIGHAKAESTRLELWTFQANYPARTFYESQGFLAVEMTDGAANMQREPDVRYVWTPDSRSPEYECH